MERFLVHSGERCEAGGRIRAFCAGPWAVLLLFLCAFLLYFSLIGKGSYYPDALIYLVQVEKTLSTGQLQPYLTGYHIPMILGSLIVASGKLLGLNDPVVLLNFLSVLFGALGIVAFFLFLRQVFDASMAMISAGLLLICPMYFSLSTFGGSQIMAMFFLFWGCYLLMRFVHGRDTIWGAVLALGFLGASRPQDLVFMFMPLSFLLVYALRRRRAFFHDSGREGLWGQYIVFWALVAGIILFVPIPFLVHDGKVPGWADIKGLYIAYMTSNPTQVGTIYRAFLFSARAISQELNPIVLASVVGGVLLLVRNNRQILSFFLLWFFCAFSSYTCLFHKVMPAERYLLLSVPPLMVLAGYFFQQVLVSGGKALKLAIVVLVSGLCFLYFMRVIPTLTIRHAVAMNNDFARWVALRTEPGAVIFSSDQATFIREFGRRDAVILPFGDVAFAENRIREELKTRKPVYLLVPLGGPFELVVLNRLARQHEVELMGEHLFEWWAHSLTVSYLSRQGLFRIRP